MRIRNVLPKAFFALSLLFLSLITLYPLAWLLARAFATPEWTWTLENLRQAFTVPRLREGLLNTLWISLLVCCLSVPTGLGLAYLSARARLPARGLLRLLAVSPLLCPPIVAAVAWTLLADRQGGWLNLVLKALGLPGVLNIYSYGGLVFVTWLLTVPIAYLVLEGTVRQVNVELEEQARLCGAGQWQTFRRVTWPLLLPGLTSAALLCFLQSNIQFGIHAPIGLPANIWILTTLIYTSTMVGPVDLGVAAALAFLLVLLSLLFLGGQQWLLARRRYTVVTGRSRPAAPAELGPWKFLALGTVALYLVLAVVLPYGVLILRSFKPFQTIVGGDFSALFSGWSLSAYRSLGEGSVAVRAVLNSLWLAAMAAVGCVALSLVVGYLVFRTRLRGREIPHALVLTAPALSGMVVGVGFIYAFGKAPLALYGTPWILLVAYMAREMATAFKALEGPCRQLDPQLEEAALLCGASWPMVGWRILWPLVRPAAAGGAVLVFIAAFRELGASALLYSHGNEVVGSVMMVIWHDGRYQDLSAFAVASAIVCLAGAGILRVFIGGRHAAGSRSRCGQSFR